MSENSGDAEQPDPIEAGLAAYLALRERDMDLWRRASLFARLSHSSMLALVAILRAQLRDAPLRQVDVQRLLRLSPAGTSALITELEGRDLVRRVAAPNDRRAFLLATGPAAEPIALEISAYDAEIKALLATLPSSGLEAVTETFTAMRALVEDKYAPSALEA